MTPIECIQHLGLQRQLLTDYQFSITEKELDNDTSREYYKIQQEIDRIDLRLLEFRNFRAYAGMKVEFTQESQQVIRENLGGMF